MFSKVISSWPFSWWNGSNFFLQTWARKFSVLPCWVPFSLTPVACLILSSNLSLSTTFFRQLFILDPRYIFPSILHSAPILWPFPHFLYFNYIICLHLCCLSSATRILALSSLFCLSWCTQCHIKDIQEMLVGWMHEWMNEWMDVWLNKWTNEQCKAHAELTM